jgi:hypothetical protein
MRQASGQAGPPPWQGCQVCVAAYEFVQAHDLLVNTGMDRVPDTGRNSNHPIIKRMHRARQGWDYARGARHTGAPHAPVVTP